MPTPVANALVFLTSAAILVLELLAARLLIPYVGNTLETYTAIIGTILAGIALGTWLGGRAADRRDPAGFLAPLLVAGGALALITVPLTDALAGSLRGTGPVTTTTLTVLTFLAPAAVLAAVTPAVIKLQLAHVDHTGRVVGRLSALSTAGAIVGTFLTGFVLVGIAPTRASIRGVGVLLVVGGIAIDLLLRRRRSARAGDGLGLPSLLVALLALAGSFAAAAPCQVESAYFCASVRVDPERPTGRVLVLDTLRHGYVDLADPTHLEFTYIAWYGDVIAAIAPDGRALDVLHVGGGAFSVPRYLDAAHPGTRSVVLELDPAVVRLARAELGLELGDGIEVITGDARRAVARTEGPFDLVVGDAFGGLAVPWHLATREFTEELAARMAPDGVYVLNVIDHGRLAFLRAELATLATVFAHVAVLGHPGTFGADPDGATSRGGNFVLIASDAPLPLAAIAAANAARGADDALLAGAALTAFVGDAAVLVDDRAPVDQLLTARP
jgi:spermidine synthase